MGPLQIKISKKGCFKYCLDQSRLLRRWKTCCHSSFKLSFLCKEISNFKKLNTDILSYVWASCKIWLFCLKIFFKYLKESFKKLNGPNQKKGSHIDAAREPSRRSRSIQTQPGSMQTLPGYHPCLNPPLSHQKWVIFQQITIF